MSLTEQNSSTWCINAEHNLCVSNDGSTKMCCMIKDSYNGLSKSSDWSLKTHSVEENFNNPMARRIRENLNNGIRDEACELCWQEEDSGRHSKRVRDNNIPGLTFIGLGKIEINVSNLCNIKCRTCNIWSSSFWVEEWYDLLPEPKKSFQVFKDTNRNLQTLENSTITFWDDLETHLETITHIDFYGGEPFLSKPMWKFLTTCVDKGYAKNISLHFNTNGTVWPPGTELFSEFKIVDIAFSIDGIGEPYEFMRFPAKWSTTQQTMRKASDYNKLHGNLHLSWCITLSNFNVYNLPETLDMLIDNYPEFHIYLNLVHWPTEFNIGIAPPEVKNAVIAQLEKALDRPQSKMQVEGIIGFVKTGTTDLSLWKKFLEKVNLHDGHRNQNFYEVFAEYGKIIKGASDDILE